MPVEFGRHCDGEMAIKAFPEVFAGSLLPRAARLIFHPPLTNASGGGEEPVAEAANGDALPPLQFVFKQHQQEVLWSGLREGLFQSVATEQTPVNFQTQNLPRPAMFNKIPKGTPSLEERIMLICTCGFKTGKTDLRGFVISASTQAANLFGRFSRNGAIHPGAEANSLFSSLTIAAPTS